MPDQRWIAKLPFPFGAQASVIHKWVLFPDQTKLILYRGMSDLSEIPSLPSLYRTKAFDDQIALPAERSN